MVSSPGFRGAASRRRFLRLETIGQVRAIKARLVDDGLRIDGRRSDGSTIVLSNVSFS
jgi:hypothetical protein